MTVNSKPIGRSRGLVIAGLLILVPLALLGIFVPYFRLISLAAVALGIMTVPLFKNRNRGQTDWFSPWNWLFYFAFFGVFLRSIYITFDIPNEFAIRSTFLGRESKDFLIWPMVIVLVGLSCTTLGYLAGPKTPRKMRLRIFQSGHWNENRLWITFSVLLGLSWIGFYFFITNIIGSIDLENLSATRGLTNDLSEYASYGYFRWMINLSDIACFLVAAKMSTTRRIRLPDAVVFLLSLGTSVCYYFYVQARGGIIVVAINILAVSYYLYGGKRLDVRKLSIKKAVISVPLAMFVIRWMTILRPGAGFAQYDWLDLNPAQAFEPLIINTNGIDVSKTAHIMGALGRQLDFEWGWTLLNAFTMWIPRQWWPEKPINVDTMIGMTVFGGQTYGAGAVPPGLIAEMYWNFWIPGIIIGCFLVGYFLRIVFTQFSAYSNNRNVVLLYVLVFMPLGGAFMGSGFSSALISFLMSSLPLIVVLSFVNKRSIGALTSQ